MQSLNHPAPVEPLQEEDLHLFYSSYREVVAEKIPCFENLLFFNKDNVIDAEQYVSSFKTLKKMEGYFKRCETQESHDHFCYCADQAIIFTIPMKERECIAVISGVDSYFSNHVSSDWLEEFRKTVIWNFLLIKGAGIDPETGLPNSRVFYTTLERFPGAILPSILLVELFPRARSSRESQIHTAKAVRSLRSCIDGKLPLFYLGNHLFGVIGSFVEGKSCHILGRKILSWLRSDGFRKIHIGMRRGNELIGENTNKYREAVEQAYFALQTAGKRGPFSLCDYHRLRNPEEHPLRKPSKALLAKFRRRWQGVEHFSIVQFKSAQSKDTEFLAAGLIDNNVICEGQDVYVFLPETGSQEALRRSKEWLSALDVGDILTGVASFPYFSFTKSQTVFNCRKALHHASFFGPCGSAVFDAVSLNVSGDIYYAEGDLTSAVREYRTGLICDPVDTNLLNSLGVSYADMDKHREALQCFEKVLSFDPTNFMALYNAGLGAELNGRQSDAVDCFERAWCQDTEFSEEKDDLAFHLGRLYCLAGRYGESVDVLLPWYQKQSGGKPKEKALPYLGRSYHSLGQDHKAMIWLQRALKYNEFDAESMGLLGLVYLLNKEGDDIALTLCEKSTDIEPDNINLKMYLAKVQIACRLHGEARATLNKCLRNKTTRTEAQLLSALNYKEEGQVKRARFWIKTLLENTALDNDIAAQAHSIEEELDGL